MSNDFYPSCFFLFPSSVLFLCFWGFFWFCFHSISFHSLQEQHNGKHRLQGRSSRTCRLQSSINRQLWSQTTVTRLCLPSVQISFPPWSSDWKPSNSALLTITVYLWKAHKSWQPARGQRSMPGEVQSVFVKAVIAKRPSSGLIWHLWIFIPQNHSLTSTASPCPSCLALFLLFYLPSLVQRFHYSLARRAKVCVYSCVSEEQRRMNAALWARLPQTLMHWKGFINTIARLSVWGKWGLRGVHYSIWFGFFSLPRSTNQNMYDTAYPCCIAQTTAAANTSTSVVVLCLCCAGRLQGIH